MAKSEKSSCGCTYPSLIHQISDYVTANVCVPRSPIISVSAIVHDVDCRHWGQFSSVNGDCDK
jgi:hypothetical protein